MYKGIIEESIHAKANEPIPFVTIYNDGKCTDIPNDGMTKLIAPDYNYVVTASVVIYGAPRNKVLEMQLYSGDVPIPHAVSVFTSNGNTFSITLNITDILHAKFDPDAPDCACINVRMNTDCLITDGIFCVS